MSHPIGFERWEPGHPWGDVVYSDGTKTSVMDPDGEIESEAMRYGAKYSAKPLPNPEPTIEPALNGAASPPLPPSTPSPSAPPMPRTAPLSDEERRQVAPTPEELKSLQPIPGTEHPVAKILAENGVDPASLRRTGATAPTAAPATSAPAAPAPQGGLAAATEAVRQHAPQLLPAKGAVQYEGPDSETRANVQGAADLSLQQKGQAISQGVEAKALNLQDQAGAANQAYFEGWQEQQKALGGMGALTKARDAAAAKLATAKQTPIADHPDFPDWFVATSILGSIAGGFAEGFSGGRYKSTTLPMLQGIVQDWRETQKYNKGNLISSLEQQLGDADAALNAGGARVKDSLADMADAQAKFARTVEARRELEATAAGLRASALEDWSKAQALVMGKESASLSLQPPEPGGTGARNPIEARIRALGYTPEQYTKGLNGKTKEGENSPTIAQAATATKQIDADISLLESISAANGGTLPTKGVINIPQALVPTLSRLGYKPGMAADEAMALINTYVTMRAKSYGGVITESDRESAVKEMGASGESFISALRRLRESNNNGIRTALSQHFPGAGQAMLEILLDDSASYGGVSAPQVAPFEKQNGPAAVESSAPPMANPELRVAPEEQARIDAELARRREEDERGRREREAEVARRRERPIPGSKL